MGRDTVATEARRPGEVRSEEVQCFLQGTRVEGRAIRLSGREALLSLPSTRPLPPGTLIGMTFPTRRRGPFGVFLYGRSREEVRADSPVHVVWEKAVTAGSPEDLRWFLREILDIREAEVQEETWGPRQETRRVFLFAHLTAPSASPRRDPLNPEPIPAKTALGSGDPLEDLELEVIALDPEGRPLERDGLERTSGSGSRGRPDVGDRSPARERPHSSRSPAPEASSTSIRDLPVPLSGRLEADGFGLEVSVQALGRSGLRVATAFVPIRPDRPVELAFRIPTRRGEETVRCECLLEEVQDRTLRLSLRKVLQETSRGVLERYLRYLEIPPRNGPNGPPSPPEIERSRPH